MNDPEGVLRFEGKKNSRRLDEVRTQAIVLLGDPVRFMPYRKKTLTYAVKMRVPFIVDTLEGEHTGKAGDYLAVGIHGEMYPIDAAVFEESYEPVPFEPKPESADDPWQPREGERVVFDE